jgi:hypothetical protein
VFKWRDDNDLYNTTAEIDFKGVEEGTIVTLIEYGYEDTAVA